MSATIRRRPAGSGALGVALAAGLLVAAPSGAGAAPRTAGVSTALRPALSAVTSAPSSADRRIGSSLSSRVTTSRFGSAFTGAVVDAASGRLVWSRNGTSGLMPASTTKLVTATDALATFGSSHRFTTTVRQGAQQNQADQVVLVGSGDPDLSSAQLAALAKAAAAKMKAARQTRVRLYADDSLFAAPTLATGWKSSYVPADTTWLRSLVVDRHDVPDTALDAAKVFAAKLKANGITVDPHRARSRRSEGAPAGVVGGGHPRHEHLAHDADVRQRARRGPAPPRRDPDGSTATRGPRRGRPRQRAWPARASRPPPCTTGRACRAATG